LDYYSFLVVLYIISSSPKTVIFVTQANTSSKVKTASLKIQAEKRKFNTGMSNRKGPGLPAEFSWRITLV
jgi:hypothetical protein